MPKYAIAFIIPTKDSPFLCHRLIEEDNQERALRCFFDKELKEYYSADDQGFYYFKEDFFDDHTPSGSIIEL